MDLIFPATKDAFLTANLSVLRPMKAILLDATQYTVIPEHKFLSDIPSNARVATAPLSDVTVKDGVVSAADLNFETVEGPTVHALLIYQEGNTMQSSRLIRYVDGFEKVPNGEDIKVTWVNGKVFSI